MGRWETNLSGIHQFLVKAVWFISDSLLIRQTIPLLITPKNVATLPMLKDVGCITARFPNNSGTCTSFLVRTAKCCLLASSEELLMLPKPILAQSLGTPEGTCSVQPPSWKDYQAPHKQSCCLCWVWAGSWTQVCRCRTTFCRSITRGLLKLGRNLESNLSPPDHP